MAKRKAADNSNLGMLITLSGATLLIEISNDVVTFEREHTLR